MQTLGLLRELPMESGEGERVTKKFIHPQSYAGSFRHASRATFLPEEGFFDNPIIPQIGREIKFSAEILCLPILR